MDVDERSATFSSLSGGDLSNRVGVGDIYSAVTALENGERLNEFQSLLLDQGSSMDGMQPKAFVNIEGFSWILKLPSKMTMKIKRLMS